MRKAALFTVMVVMSAGFAWGSEDVMDRARAMFKPVPLAPPVIKGNPATPAKVDLGIKLFFDPRLSASQLISCNTCHNLGLGGADLQETSIGHGWQKGPRNAPTVFNAVFDFAQFWDGRAADLQAQAKGPVQAAVEMNNRPEQVVRTLKSIPGYDTLFKKAFPGEKDPITFDNMAKAIEVFEARLLTPNSRFDRYLRGERKAMSASEVEGLRIFMDKGCVACHAGINIGGEGYYPFGVREVPSADIRPLEDTGRFKVTRTESDMYVFKAPSLRNLTLTQPYFHSGKVWSVSEAVKVMGSSQLGIELAPGQATKIAAFLQSLNGTPPKITYPILPPSSERTPMPATK